MAIVESTFERLAFDHLLTDEEAARVVRELASPNLPRMLERMHASADREAFAERWLLPLVAKQVKARRRIVLRLEG